MPKVLFTGGSGLLALNWAYCLKDKWTIFLGLHRRKISPTFATVLDLDLCSETNQLHAQLVRHKIDLVINTVGLTDVDYCEANPQSAHHINCVLAERVAAVCEALSIKLIHISSDQLFDGNSQYYLESSIPSPLNVYGRTKYQAEIEVGRVAPSALILRTNFYCWGTAYRQSYSDYLLRSVRTKALVEVPSDIYFTPMLVSELVDVVNGLLSHGCYGVYNVSSDVRLSKYDFARLLVSHMGGPVDRLRPILSSQLGDRAPRPLDMSLCNTKASIVIGRPIGDVSHQLSFLSRQASVHKEFSCL